MIFEVLGLLAQALLGLLSGEGIPPDVSVELMQLMTSLAETFPFLERIFGVVLQILAAIAESLGAA